MSIKTGIVAVAITCFATLSFAEVLIDNQTAHKITVTKVPAGAGEGYAVSIDDKPVVPPLLVVFALMSGAGGKEDEALAQLAKLAVNLPVLSLAVVKVTLQNDSTGICRENSALIAQVEESGIQTRYCLVTDDEHPLYTVLP